jgi:hypothetical protein
MRVENKVLLFLVPAMFALGGPFACGSDDDNGDGGAGGTGASGSSSTGIPSVASSTGTGVAQSSSTGNPDVCAGLGATFGGAEALRGCADCLEANCCVELSDAEDQQAYTEELNTCSTSACADECHGASTEPGGIGTIECGAGSAVPSEGACVVPGIVAQCNPVTNEPCGDGNACDQAQGGIFQCFGPPNDVQACGTCDNGNGPFCIAGYTCVGDGGTKCAKYCCTDEDCAPGTCVKETGGNPTFPNLPARGICHGDGGVGGAGGTGGAGGAGGAGATGGTGGTGGA